MPRKKVVDDLSAEFPDFSESVRRFVSSKQPFSPRLPLTHLTRMVAFRGIIEGDTLEPTHCEVFGEPLTYLFYGRPAYRAKENTYHKLTWSIPMLFILDPDKLYKIKRVYPFDTGAFYHNLYGNVFAPRSKLEHFELEPSILSAQKMVSALYEDNKTYYSGQSRKDIPLSDFEFELQGLKYLAQRVAQQSTSGGHAADERASTIEIQVDHSIDIPSNTIHLIVPETIYGDSLFKQAIARWGIGADRVETYDGVVGPDSEAWVGQLYEKVKQYYSVRGYLPKFK